MNFKQSARLFLDRAGLMNAYFAFVEWRISRKGEAPPATDEDGVSIPPLRLIARIIAISDWRAFLKTGKTLARTFARHARDGGLPFSEARRILDVGCGCGRIVRNLPKLTDAELYGVDYNKDLVDWCAQHLPGEFKQNGLTPPLDFPDDYFDIIYLMSVFTHLRIPTQREWLSELARVTRPGGLVLVTFHDETQPRLPDDEAAKQAFERDGYVIANDLAEGSNLMATFQKRAFTEKLFGEFFDVVRMLSYEESGVGQALAVLKKKN